MHESSLATDFKKIKEDLLQKEKYIVELKSTINNLKKEINKKEEEHRNKIRESRKNESGISDCEKHFFKKVN